MCYVATGNAALDGKASFAATGDRMANPNVFPDLGAGDGDAGSGGDLGLDAPIKPINLGLDVVSKKTAQNGAMKDLLAVAVDRLGAFRVIVTRNFF